MGGEEKDDPTLLQQFLVDSESWKTKSCNGTTPPLGLYDGASASSGRYAYCYGGYSSANGDYHHSLYRLDTDVMHWCLLSQGPIRMTGGCIISYKDNIFVFSGYGDTPTTIQQGAEFIEDRSNPGHGWSNEIYCFNIQEGEGVQSWSDVNS